MAIREFFLIALLSALILFPGIGISYEGDTDGSVPPSERESTDRFCTNSETHIRISGYLQAWWTIFEDAENELRQPFTGDHAIDHSSGFSLRRARLCADFTSSKLKGCVSIRLENNPPVPLDAYVSLSILDKRIVLWAG